MQVEHRWIEFKGGVAFDSADTVAGMNELGKEGWRLCGKLHELSIVGRGPMYGAFFYRERKPVNAVEAFKLLKRGSIVRPVGGGQSYVVEANYGDRVTAVRTVELTNPDEWEIVKMKLLCECNSSNCTSMVDMTPEEARKKEHNGWVAIADDCPHGPESDDVLVSVRVGTNYKLWEKGI
jgi:hypothetical protein